MTTISNATAQQDPQQAGLMPTALYRLGSQADPGPAAAPLAASTSSSVVSISSQAYSLLEEDRTAPTVTTFSPADGSTGATVNANITLTFSEAIQRGKGNIVLKTASGKVVETFSAAKSSKISIEGNVLTIDPSKDLAANTKYVVTFSAGTVTDLAGNKFAGTRSYDFRTGADTVAPTVTKFVPAEGGVGAFTHSNIALTFSESIVRGTGNIVLKNGEGAIIESFNVADSARVKIRGNVLTVDPTRDLDPNSQYTMEFEPGVVRDRAGNAFAGANSYGFSTGADTTGPKVTQFSPADGSRGAAINAHITLTFSEAIQRGVGNIQLKNAAGKVVETFNAATSDRIRIRDNVLIIDPTKDLAPNSRYFVSFAAGTVTDQTGNKFAGTKTYDFRTGREAAPQSEDTVAPTVTGFQPTPDSTNASITSNLSVTFSEEVRRGIGSILLRDGAGRLVESFDAASSERLSFSGSTLTIDPTRNLISGTRYTVSFAAGSVQDVAGNDYAGEESFGFTTAQSAFNIDLVYSGDQAYRQYFDNAIAKWRQIIIGDLPNINGIDDLKITANIGPIDGVYGTLGHASPTLLRPGSFLPFEGTMTFDSADMANMIGNGTLQSVIVHEMGHVLGLGTLWATKGFNSSFGQYTGAQALEAYRQMSGNADASHVPLEQNGGDGTRNVHWSEDIFDAELMTGYSENHPNMPLSVLSVAALVDLGYQVNIDAADTFRLVA